MTVASNSKQARLIRGRKAKRNREDLKENFARA